MLVKITNCGCVTIRCNSMADAWEMKYVRAGRQLPGDNIWIAGELRCAAEFRRDEHKQTRLQPGHDTAGDSVPDQTPGRCRRQIL